MHDSRRISEKYCRSYAEPEVGLASAIDAEYARAVVVPAYRESASLIDGYSAAARAASGRTLVVVVVNGAIDRPPEAHAENEALLRQLLARGSQPSALGRDSRAWLVPCARFDLLLVDRASVERRFAAKQGVGLARKIGCDLALALHVTGRVRSPWIHSTDADVVLPDDYFRQTDGEDGGAALLFPYAHEAAGDPELDWATALYEVGLRYYVLGLAHARSPYAFHTIGSTLAVDAAAYAGVRGFPRRLAGEDFYLCDKLAKIGPIRRAKAGTVRIRARWSDRAPFGTGRGVRRIADERRAGRASTLHDPRLFEVLGCCLSGFDAFCETRRLDALGDTLARLPEQPRRAVEGYFVAKRVREELVAAAAQSADSLRLCRRLATWFDGLRTLQLLHAVRAHALPDLPWFEALARAPFCHGLDPELDPRAITSALAARELGLPERVGPTTVRAANGNESAR